MPFPGYPHLVKETSRAKTFWYVRVYPGPRLRIRAEPGTKAFRKEYDRLVGIAERGEKPGQIEDNGAVSGTLHWLWHAYCQSAAWNSLAPTTRRQRENIMKHVLAAAAKAPIAQITRKVVRLGLEKRSKKPSAAKNYLSTLRHLFDWAVDAEYVKTNPCDGLHVDRPGTDGFPAWTDEDEAKFVARWPLGTRQYLAYMVHACTGLRRGDAVRLQRQHFGKDGKINLKAEKNGVELHIPVHALLVAAIQACPPSGMFVLETGRGTPWVKESYGNEFHEWTVAAGVVEAGKPKNSHGIRKLAATRVCDAGASESEMMALFGWTDAKMARLYTENRDKQRLAAQAGAKVGAVGAIVPLFASD